MEALDIAYRIFSAVQDVVVIILGVLAWLMNRKLGKVTKRNSTESNKLDSAENNKIAESTAKEITMQSEVLETPVTTVKRDLKVTLSESEVETLRQVIESSGRSSDVKELYQAIQNFTINKK